MQHHRVAARYLVAVQLQVQRRAVHCLAVRQVLVHRSSSSSSQQALYLDLHHQRLVAVASDRLLLQRHRYLEVFHNPQQHHHSVVEVQHHLHSVDHRYRNYSLQTCLQKFTF